MYLSRRTSHKQLIPFGPVRAVALHLLYTNCFSSLLISNRLPLFLRTEQIHLNPIVLGFHVHQSRKTRFCSIFAPDFLNCLLLPLFSCYSCPIAGLFAAFLQRILQVLWSVPTFELVLANIFFSFYFPTDHHTHSGFLNHDPNVGFVANLPNSFIALASQLKSAECCLNSCSFALYHC